MTLSEIIPRRNSCQISLIEKKKTKFSNKWKKNDNQTIPKPVYFLFSLLNSNLHISQSFHVITVPFGFRITLKKTCIVSENRWKINKKKIFKKISKKKIGKILSKSDFEKKIKNFRFRHRIFKRFSFFLEEKNKKNNIRKIQKIFSLGERLVLNLKIGKNPMLNIIVALSSFWIKFNSKPFFSIKINGKNCPKKIHNNLSQIFGTIIDYFPGSFENIQKTSIKFKNSISFAINTGLKII